MVQADRNQPIAERLREVAADEDRPIERFRHSLDPADQIDRWPDDGEVEPIGRADCAITARAEIHGHDDFEWRSSAIAGSPTRRRTAASAVCAAATASPATLG